MTELWLALLLVILWLAAEDLSVCAVYIKTHEAKGLDPSFCRRPLTGSRGVARHLWKLPPRDATC